MLYENEIKDKQNQNILVVGKPGFGKHSSLLTEANILKQLENTCIKEDTHVVLKREDISGYLTEDEQKQLNNLTNKIVAGRKLDGKNENYYLVCNCDEPYAAEVYKTILEGEQKKMYAGADKEN